MTVGRSYAAGKAKEFIAYDPKPEFEETSAAAAEEPDDAHESVQSLSRANSEI